MTEYPPEVQFSRPIDWRDGDSAAMQRSQDATFATGVSEVVNTIYAATTTYDFGLSNVVSGSWFFRMAAWRGTRPVSLNWSNIVNVGDTVAPTITSSNSPSGYKYLAGSLALTANEGVTWAITGGADSASFSIVGSTLSWGALAVASAVVKVKATDYAGNVSTEQTITLTLAANNPTAFSFTDVNPATPSSPYTSNTIEIEDGQPGSVWPYTFSGDGTLYIKLLGSGSWLAAGTSGTTVETDQFKVDDTGPAAGNSNNVLTVGGISDTYTLVGPFDYTGFFAAYDVSHAGAVFQNTAGTTPATADGDDVCYLTDLSGSGRHLIAPTTGEKWTLRVSGGHKWLERASTSSALKCATGDLEINGGNGEWWRLTAFRQLGWAAHFRIWAPGAGASTGHLYQDDTTPKIRTWDGVDATPELSVTIGTDVVLEEKHKIAGTYLKVGGTQTSLTATGNATMTGLILGDTSTGTANIRFYGAIINDDALDDLAGALAQLATLYA